MALLKCGVSKNLVNSSHHAIKIFLFLLSILLLACESVPQGDGSNASAVWDSNSGTLTISGKTSLSEGNIQIHNALDGTLLGAAVINADGSWQASATTATCDVHVTLPDGTESISVQNAPQDCGASDLMGRVLTDGDIPEGVLVVSNPVPLNTVPNAVILSPPQDMVINAGQTVNFAGTATGTSITPPVSYFWNFGGAAPNSLVQNPGPVRFDIPGTYFIQLSVTDNLGIPDPTPAVRTITVNGFNGPVGSTPVPVITSPIAINGSVFVNVGESLFFSGTASDGTGSNAFTFEWNFSGIYPNQFGATAGSIPFTQAGTFIVTLYATNALGIRSVVPAQVTVVVGGFSGVNQSPTGSITRPRNDVTINVGESLSFRASGRDPDNNIPLYYSWEFGGAAPNISMSTNPDAGNVVFNTPGIFYVRMTVTDSTGAADPNPPIRVVTVQGIPGNPFPGGNNGPLATQIISPPTDVTIAPGQSVFFSGSATSGNGLPVQYFWSFDGAAPNSNLQSPGSITFPIPGQYIVQFFAVDASGNVVGSAATRTITVQDPSNASVSIVSPVDNSTVQVGQSVFLMGNVGNTGGFGNLTYEWQIKAAGRNGNVVFTSNQISAQYVFTQPGDYRIRFRVSGIDPFGNQTVGSTATSRITVVNTGTGFPPIGTPGQGINSTGILSPATDMVIYAGDRVDFQANSFSGANVNYSWDFGGVRSPSNRQNPGQVRFNNAGTYFITLSITGTFNGVPINVFDQRVINVLQINPSFPPTNPVPQGSGILLPVTDMVINVGDSVDFEANRVSGNNVNYNWDFGGAAAPSNRRNPSRVQFNSPGTFFVTLQVTGDSNGVPIFIFDQRTITVLQQNPFFPPNAGGGIPQGSGILAPATDLIINLGDSVNFEANRISGNNITYAWDFGGVASPSSRRDPRPVTFNSPGSFVVRLQVTGSVNGVPLFISDQRVITVIQGGFGGIPGNPTNPIAQGSGILSPITDVVINVGDSVNFEANRISGNNVNYSWDFGGVSSPSNRRNPSPVRFNSPGTFLVTLQVTGDINGAPIFIFDQRLVTVIQQGNSFPPISNPINPIAAGTAILSPSTDVVINIGDSVNFEANRFSGNNVNYNWNFAGAANNSTRRNPSPVRFNSPGTFVVTLQVTGDINGVPVQMYDQRVVTVLSSAFPGTSPFPGTQTPFPGTATPFPTSPIGTSGGPEGVITQPTSPFIQVRAGQSVQFAGSGFDPLGSGPLIFQWSFGGAARNIESQNPGSITFNRVGTFVVTLLVRNSLGQFDLTPPAVVVSVTP